MTISEVNESTTETLTERKDELMKEIESLDKHVSGATLLEFQFICKELSRRKETA